MDVRDPFRCRRSSRPRGLTGNATDRQVPSRATITTNTVRGEKANQKRAVGLNTSPSVPTSIGSGADGGMTVMEVLLVTAVYVSDGVSEDIVVFDIVYME